MILDEYYAHHMMNIFSMIKHLKAIVFMLLCALKTIISIYNKNKNGYLWSNRWDHPSETFKA